MLSVLPRAQQPSEAVKHLVQTAQVMYYGHTSSCQLGLSDLLVLYHQVSTNLSFVLPVSQHLSKSPSIPAHGDDLTAGLPLPSKHSPAPSLVSRCQGHLHRLALVACPPRNLIVLDAGPSDHKPPKEIVLPSSPSLHHQKHLILVFTRAKSNLVTH